MDFKTSVSTVLNKYIEFSGRASRSEFWSFVLFSVIGNIITGILDEVLGTVAAINLLFSLAILLPSIAVGVRRLHDIDRSGWWLLLSFIPIVGWLVLLYFNVQKGTDGENRFGADPLA